MRHGFTLIETLVALVLLEIGMLALAATSAVAARDLAIAHRSVRAQALARNQLETLAARPCVAASGSRSEPGGYMVSWSVLGVERRRDLAVSVEFALPAGRQRSIALKSAALCPS